MKWIFKDSENICTVVIDKKEVMHWRISLKKGSFLLNIWALYMSVVTFLVFLVFWYFDIRLISEFYISFFYLYFFIMFKIFLFIIFIFFIYSVYIYYFKDNVKFLSKLLKVILRFLNFLVLISILYVIFNLEFGDYLQYNFFYIINMCLHWILFIYTKLFFFTYNEKKIVFFFNFPFIFLVLGWLLMKFNLYGLAIIILTSVDKECAVYSQR